MRVPVAVPRRQALRERDVLSAVAPEIAQGRCYEEHPEQQEARRDQGREEPSMVTEKSVSPALIVLGVIPATVTPAGPSSSRLVAETSSGSNPR